MKPTHTPVISIDWLQIFGYCSENLDELITNPPDDCRHYTIVKLDYGSRVFSSAAKVYSRTLGYQEELCTILWHPRSSALKPASCAIKIANSALYNRCPGDLIESLTDYFEVTYTGITRMDLCMDFRDWVGDWSIEELAARLLSREDRFRVKRLTSVNVFSVQGERETRITGIKFGSKASRANSYIYNKTFELLSEHYKPWIVSLWHKSGLLSDDERKRLEDLSCQRILHPSQVPDDLTVWRAEISVRSGATKLLDCETGEVIPISPSYLAINDNVVAAFSSYRSQYLRFVKPSGAETVTDVDVLPDVGAKCCARVLIQRTRCVKTTFNERNIISSLNRVKDTFWGESPSRREAADATISWLKDIFFYRTSIQKKIDFSANLIRNYSALAVDDFRPLYMALVQTARDLSKPISPEALEVFAVEMHQRFGAAIPEGTPHRDKLISILNTALNYDNRRPG